MEQDKSPYDFETLCTMCTCTPGNHIVYHPCPILDNNPICQDCCLVSCLKYDIAIKFSTVIGKEITLDEVNEACRKCGKNYGKQNEELAKKLENESI